MKIADGEGEPFGVAGEPRGEKGSEGKVALHRVGTEGICIPEAQR